MNTEVVIAYVLMSLFLGLIPGPSVLFTLTHSMSNSKTNTYKSIIGQLSGSFIYTSLVFLGIHSLPQSLFMILKLIGGIYVIYIGIRFFMIKKTTNNLTTSNDLNSGKRSFWTGFTICVSNPKILLHYSAFLPQFIDNSGDVTFQLLVLSGLTIITGFIVLMLYAEIPQLAKKIIHSQNFNYYLFKCAGALMCFFGIGLLFK